MPAKAKQAKKTSDPQSYEQVIAELQEVVGKLEEEDLPLDAALKAFERGVKLSRLGQQLLDSAEKKVEVLLADGSTAAIPDDPLNS